MLRAMDPPRPLSIQPANLTTLARRHGGKYPSLAVKTVIRGDSSVLAHGSKEMPVWGSLFWNLSVGDQQKCICVSPTLRTTWSRYRKTDFAVKCASQQPAFRIIRIP